MTSELHGDFAEDLAKRLGGMSVRQLAAISGWGRTTVADIRAGRQLPTETQLRDLLMSVGADEAEVAGWLDRRRAQIAGATAAPPAPAPDAGTDTPPAPDATVLAPAAEAGPPRHRGLRLLIALAGVVSLLGIGFAGGYAVRDRTLQHAREVAATATGPVVSGTRSTLVEVAQGDFHTCGRTAGGAVWCWGRNSVGQLGDGTRANSAVPVPVGGLLAGIEQIAAGGNFACAINYNGQVRCWGHNAYGQTGNKQETMQVISWPVADLNVKIKEIAVGNLHACALTEAGEAYCWGNGEHGQLGTGRAMSDSHEPVQVTGIDVELAGITAGDDFTCAWSIRDEAYCWGANARGQLGIDSREDALAPVRLTAYPLGVRTISAGAEHACAIAPAGGVDCWGEGADGRLGTGSTEDTTVPKPVRGLPQGVDDLAAGPRHTCAVTTTGEVACWGDGTSGELGPASPGSTTPVAVPGLAGVHQVSVGDRSSCGLTVDALWCWGSGAYGEIGSGSEAELKQPHRIAVP